MADEPAKQARWLVAALAVLAVLGMVLASMASRDDDADRDLLTEFLARVDSQDRLPRSRAGAVYGELQAGEAFEQYQACANELDGLAPRFAKLELREREHGAAAVRDELEALRRDWQPAMAAVHRGAHARTVQRTGARDFPEIWGPSLDREFSLRIAAGDHQQAVRLWLDAMVMAADFDRRRPAPQSMKELVALWTDERMAMLPATSRRDLARGLGWLDRELAAAIDWSNLFAPWVRMTLAGNFPTSPSLMDRLRAWDHGFSPSRQWTKACADTVRSLPLLTPVAETFSQRSRQFEAFLSARLHGRAPFGLAGMFKYMEWWRRGSLASVRLLALALQIHAEVPLEPMMDPLGDGVIRVSGAGVRFVLVAGADVWRTERVVER